VASGRAKTLDRLFRALASAPRREILRLAGRQRCAVTQFATQLNVSQSAVSKHVRVLVDAALLSKTRDGRYRWCRLRRSAFEPACESIEELCKAIHVNFATEGRKPGGEEKPDSQFENIVRCGRTKTSRRQKETKLGAISCKSAQQDSSTQ